MHRTFSVIKNAAEAAEIRLDGYIVADEDKALYEMFGYPVCCPKDFTDFLATLTGQPLTVWVHSYGGDVWAGSQIYAALKGYAGDSIAKITGLAASAASFACMGCRRVRHGADRRDDDP